MAKAEFSPWLKFKFVARTLPEMRDMSVSSSACWNGTKCLPFGRISEKFAMKFPVQDRSLLSATSSSNGVTIGARKSFESMIEFSGHATKTKRSI